MKLIDRIRGTEYPPAVTWEDWDKMHAKAKDAHPFRYWVADKAIPKIKRTFTWPVRKYRNIRAYLDNRFVHKTHVLPTYLPKGRWADPDHRLIHGMFGLLRQYVEVECARMDKFNGGPGDGLAHLKREMNCGHESQEGAAKEVHRLYGWWTVDRPSRVDPLDYSVEEGGTYDEIYYYCDIKEKEYRDQDVEMMKRLIDISPCMWA